MEQNTICTTVVMTAERMDFWEFLYVDKGNIFVRAADDFAESGAVFADAAQGTGRKGGRFQTV